MRLIVAIERTGLSREVLERTGVRVTEQDESLFEGCDTAMVVLSADSSVTKPRGELQVSLRSFQVETGAELASPNPSAFSLPARLSGLPGDQCR